jgi:hypothetical protein
MTIDLEERLRRYGATFERVVSARDALPVQHGRVHDVVAEADTRSRARGRRALVATTAVVALVIAGVLLALARSDGGERLKVTGGTRAVPTHVVAQLADGHLGVFDSRTGQFAGVVAGGKTFGSLGSLVAASDRHSVYAAVARRQGNRCDPPTIERIDLTTGAVTDPRGGPVGTTRGDAPAISPDGRYLAYLTCVGTGREAAGLADLHDGTEFRWPTPDGELGGPVWSSDSRYLAFAEGLDRVRIMMVRRASPPLLSTEVLRLPTSTPLATTGTGFGAELAGFLGEGRDTLLLRRVRHAPDDPRAPTQQAQLAATIEKFRRDLASLPPNDPRSVALQQDLQAAISADYRFESNRGLKTDAIAFDAESGKIRVLFTLNGDAQLSVDETRRHVLAVTVLGAFRWSEGDARARQLPGWVQPPTVLSPPAWLPSNTTVVPLPYRAEPATARPNDAVESCKSTVTAMGSSVSVFDHGTGQTYNVDVSDACLKVAQASPSPTDNSVGAIYYFKNGKLVVEVHRRTTTTGGGSSIDGNSPVLSSQSFSVKPGQP